MKTPDTFLETHYRPLRFNAGRESLSIRSLARRLERPEGHEDYLDINPNYQREHVWSKEQASFFMGHILEGGWVSPFVIRRYDSLRVSPSVRADELNVYDKPCPPDEVVDGKQRLTAILDWYHNKIPAILSNKDTLFLSELSKEDQRYITGMSGPVFTMGYVILSDLDVLKLYVRLNRGGTVHTKEEIDRVYDMIDDLTKKIESEE